MNVQRHQKTIEAFKRLPEEFTTEDVVRCFQLNSDGAVRSRIKRLMDDRIVEKIGEIVANNTHKAIYRKTNVIIV